MKNKLHYLFLISLIGTSYMTASASTLATESPQEGISQRENTLREKPGEPSSEQEVTLPVTPFFEDFKKHLVLWGLTTFLHGLIDTILWDYAEVSRPNNNAVNRSNNLPWKLFSGFRAKNFLRGSKSALLLCLISLPLNVLLSLVLASWKRLWRVQDEKGEQVGTPSFKVRFWRSFRFMLYSCLLIALGTNPVYQTMVWSLLHVYLVACAYGGNLQLPQAGRKAIDAKQQASDEPKSNSLAAHQV